MFNKSNIMKRAWEIYRTIRYECERKSLKTFNKTRFANSLIMAWVEAKRSQLPVKEKIQQIERQIAGLAYKPFGHRISQERHALEAQISKLAA